MNKLENVMAAAENIKEDLEYAEKIRKSKAARVIKTARQLVNALGNHLEVEGRISDEALAATIGDSLSGYTRDIASSLDAMNKAAHEAIAIRSALETILEAMALDAMA